MAKKIKILISFFLLFLPVVTYAQNLSEVFNRITWCDITQISVPGLISCVFQILTVVLLIVIVPFVIIFSIMVSILGMILVLVMEKFTQVVIAFSMRETIIRIDTAMMPLWTVIRNVALWFFAVFLAFVGLATIFRIESYWARRALVPLLIIALLFNFIPFFVRTIIAIGNSLTCYLLDVLGAAIRQQASGSTINLACTTTTGQGGTGSATSSATNTGQVQVHIEIFESGIRDAVRSFTQLTARFFNAVFDFVGHLQNAGETITRLVLVMAAAVIYAVFWFGCALALLLLAILFIVRMVYLWLLFLASPFAFATFAFRTREFKAAFPGPLHWEEWIEQFLGWAFAGVLLAFWIGIAAYLIAAMPIEVPQQDQQAMQDVINEAIGGGPTPPGGGPTPPGGEFARDLVETFLTVGRYLGGMIALYFGIMSTPPAMQGIAKGFVAVMGTVGVLTGAGALRLFGRTTRGVAKRVAKRYPRVGEMGERAIKLAERMESVFPIRMMAREIVAKMPYVGEVQKEMKKIEKEEKARLRAAEKRYKEMAEKGEFAKLTQELLSKLTSQAQKMKILEILVEKGRIDQIVVDKFFRGKTLEDIRREYGAKVERGLRVKRPDLLIYVNNPRTNRPFTPEEIQREILPQLTPKEITEISPQALTSPYIAGGIASLPNLARRLVRQGEERQKIAFYEGFLQYFENETQIPVFREYQQRRTRMSQRDAMVAALEAQRQAINRVLNNLSRQRDPRLRQQAENLERMLYSIYYQI